MNARLWQVCGIVVLLCAVSPVARAQAALPVPVPAGTTVMPLKYAEDKPALELKPAEQVAFLYVYSLWWMEGDCLDKDMGVGRLCTLRELITGVKTASGQVIGLSGDPDETCVSRPHLHLEIRSLDYRTAHNPAAWIDADWDALMLLGPFSDVHFARDRSDPLRWVRPEDQPDVRFGGALLNDYPEVWPAESADAVCVAVGC